ncbi:uncharacterized protein N7518_006116 [Penicillium psychrosexuale]|uniref:uncharacterized protein n=1 Tax=Penicillium psychrosexuale TaxID=1002107 RepID=UPI0025457095|nr:uncharacterized protein N7518_006116 [Penicillium psychrosexuale]KAJ5789105.1 hypothetical protein N7518_006116 [Penicillium psychrosexuale]
MSSSQKGPSSSPSAASFGASQPVKNTFLRRYSTLIAIKLLERIRPRQGNVLMLTGGICVKHGCRVYLSEASTMRFISQHTSIPVPKVFCAFTRSGRTYIVMERIQGDIIGKRWVYRSEDSKAKLLSQLAEKILEMRKLQPPEGNMIANVDGGSLFDCRVAGTSLRFGPFKNIQDFHRHIRMGMEFDPRLPPDIQELIKQHSKTWPLVFTHGDLSSLNILVRGDDLVGIIDWETAGWYPSYWKYTTAYQVNPHNTFWVHEIDKFLQPMPEELAMDQVRLKYFADV